MAPPPKDRAAPFSRKHKRYWLPVTGMMVVIGVLNLAIGMYLWAKRPRDAPRITLPDVAAAVDARVRANTATDDDRTFAAAYDVEQGALARGLAQYLADHADQAGNARAALARIGADGALSVFDAAVRAGPSGNSAALSALDNRFVAEKDELDQALLAFAKNAHLTS